MAPDYPGHVGNTYVVKVTADDGQGVGGMVWIPPGNVRLGQTGVAEPVNDFYVQIETPAQCTSYNGFYFGNGTLCAPSDTCLTTDVEGTSASVRRLQLLVAPNPAAEGVVIRCLLPLRTMTTLALFDASGRMVRRLHEGDLAAGETPFSWDGLDDAGQAPASGVYWARMETGSGRVVGKVVWAR